MSFRLLERIAHNLIDGRTAFKAFPVALPPGLANPEDDPETGQQRQEHVRYVVDPLPADRHLLEALAAIPAGFLESIQLQHQ